MSPSAERKRQGSEELRDRPHDEIAYATSHNAMSTTADRFTGPLQDPNITAQLNDGVRALKIDTYRWERSEQIAERLEQSDFMAEQRALITCAVDTFNPPGEGLWLCYSVCRPGALPLVPTLREIGAWMRDHPNDVVTLIIQDAITGDETVQAIKEAGLQDLVHTPRPDPEMSCAPHRGGADKRLFLLNHFVTIDGGSRPDAGEVNAGQFVIGRALACERERGRPVNFVAVDYATLGDAQGGVAALNERDGDDKASITE
ncbi:hypothetical protein ABZX40_04620 [Streptomyces sp. NPDC004610]|uniref:hypothetical protein n=1 Tax=unclassified Streptomyces TaxID=2593676 RepID=UPI0033ADE917